MVEVGFFSRSRHGTPRLNHSPADSLANFVFSRLLAISAGAVVSIWGLCLRARENVCTHLSWVGWQERGCWAGAWAPADVAGQDSEGPDPTPAVI